MDDAKKAGLSLIVPLLILCASLAGHASGELEYISPSFKTELEKTFDQAEFSNRVPVRGREWTCDMYGMRTRLQVKRGVKLYRFDEGREETWHNRGAQLVEDYRLADGRLTGTRRQLEDQVKVTPQGKLISRLSVLEPERQVVAYSICTAAATN